MTWIESHQELREHPKLKRLARSLSISRKEATGLLHWLWWWAMDYAPDGDLSAFSVEDIADGVDWEGDHVALVSALQTAGFLDDLRLHDWDQYGEKLHRRRAANAKRMREARMQEETERAEHVQRTCETREVLEDRTGQDRTGHKDSPRGTATAAPGSTPNGTAGQRIMAAFVDEWRVVHSADPTGRAKGQWGDRIRDLLTCGHAEPAVREAVVCCVREGKGPSVIELKLGDLKAGAGFRPDPEAEAEYVAQRMRGVRT